ncbi:MAG: SpoIIE family protein phosphatase [Lachnospiraceae bacterium]|nr:SpoIIE family protein phosphatase [Lachnospiraceae bacterium]
MANMIVKMSLVTISYIVVTIILWICVGNKKMNLAQKILIGLVFGICSILSTHFGIDYGHMMLNVRDLGPLIAGLYFDPLSGVISGIIGGVERYIAGTYFNVGHFTRVACSISTFLAGILGFILNRKVYKDSKPEPTSAFFIGAVMEVFHMYVVLITHRDDMTMAFYVVDACSIPMIVFSAIGLAGASISIISFTDDWKYFIKKKVKEEVPISSRIQNRLFIVMCILMLSHVVGTFFIQNQSATQSVKYEIEQMSDELRDRFEKRERIRSSTYIGSNGIFSIYDNAGRIIYGYKKNSVMTIDDIRFYKTKINQDVFEYSFYGNDSICKVISLGSEYTGIIAVSTNSVFWYRNARTYESIFFAILMVAVVYFVISIVVNKTVVVDIQNINKSLAKITDGDLNEVVNVRNSKEFAILSDDINETVSALKGYIDKEKLRMKEELELASSIQLSALPNNFIFPHHNEFEIYAIMDAAKGVGGDFYDFFFVGRNRFALVIADVSGKGVPGALFMMKAKNIIRSYAEKESLPDDIMFKANNALCKNNEADMFVTAWMGIIDLEKGIMKCANYGHEFPILKRFDGDYEILKDEHSLPLATFENIKAKVYDIKFNIGDEIFLYTDGVPEATNEKNEAYGIEKMLEILNNNKSKSLEEILKSVRRDVADFANSAEQFDDITMFGFRYLNYSKDSKE